MGALEETSSLVAGASVLAAGQLTVCDGCLLAMSNESGHYAPAASSHRLSGPYAAAKGVGAGAVRLGNLNFSRSSGRRGPRKQS